MCKNTQKNKNISAKVDVLSQKIHLEVTIRKKNSFF